MAQALGFLEEQRSYVRKWNVTLELARKAELARLTSRTAHGLALTPVARKFEGRTDSLELLDDLLDSAESAIEALLANPERFGAKLAGEQS
jgi:hypothetical protein